MAARPRLTGTALTRRQPRAPGALVLLWLLSAVTYHVRDNTQALVFLFAQITMLDRTRPFGSRLGWLTLRSLLAPRALLSFCLAPPREAPAFVRQASEAQQASQAAEQGPEERA